MNPRAPWAAAAFAAPLLLSSCASLAPTPVTPAEQQATATRPYRASIELDGRLSVRYQGQYREEALHGGFSWSQTPARVDVALLSPLGQTLAMIDETPDGARLQQAGEQPRYAANVDDLTVKALGWPLPVAGLRYWLQGFATDASGRRFVATPATPAVTTSDGWHISYSEWEDADKQAAPLRPRRIDLERNTAQAGEVAIRIVIDSWQPR